MPNTTKVLHAGCMTLLLTTGASFAQEACKTYTVKAGENLRSIARAAYDDPDLYRVIYNANAAVIGAKADLIEIGMVLTIPCDAAEPAPVAADETAAPAATTETTASAAASQVLPDVQPIGLVTGNDLAPFTDQVLPGGGMITQLVEMAIFRADPQLPYNLTFIDDWQAHIDALLPAKAYDLSFPWTRPNCEAAGSLSASDLNRCENYVFSAPFFETVDGFFVKTGSDLSLATHYEEFAGKEDLPARGLFDQCDGRSRAECARNRTCPARPSGKLLCRAFGPERWTWSRLTLMSRHQRSFGLA